MNRSDERLFVEKSYSGYEDWRDNYVETKKNKGENNSTLIPSSNGGTIKGEHRTKEQFEEVANNIRREITEYSENESKWSGNINIDNTLESDGVTGKKEWSCDISLVDTADDGTVWHEMLHSCSASYYDKYVYAANEYIEEASVEFLTRQICIEKNIIRHPAYENLVLVLEKLNEAFSFGKNIDFAKELFNVPLPERYAWIESKVDEALRAKNVSFEDYYDVIRFLENLKGGKNEK